jgi:hypothetical protein
MKRGDRGELYFDYSELQGIRGRWKPPQSQGDGYVVIDPKGATIEVIGSHAGHIRVNPGQSMGYTMGEAWLVPSP